MNLDTLLFHLLNDFVGTIPALDWLTQVIVNDYIVPTLVTLAAVWMWFAGGTRAERTRNQRAVVFIVLGLLFANALIKDLALVYFRPRPFATEAVKLLFYRPSVSSFPSVPVAVAFSFGAGAWYANKRLGRLLLVLGSLYALARVYAGVHYPLDVIAGAAVGAGAVYAVVRLDIFFTPLADWIVRLMDRLAYV